MTAASSMSPQISSISSGSRFPKSCRKRCPVIVLTPRFLMALTAVATKSFAWHCDRATFSMSRAEYLALGEGDARAPITDSTAAHRWPYASRLNWGSPRCMT